MSDTVTLPASVARDIANHLRSPGQTLRDRSWPDLLDPPPLTLRERVARALAASDSNPWDEANHSAYFVNADAAILEIATAIEALYAGISVTIYRKSVLNLLDGESDV